MLKTPIHSLFIYKKNISENLKYLLDFHSMSILDLASKLEISYGSMHGLINGKSNPTIETLAKVAGYFNVNIPQIISDGRINFNNAYFNKIVPIIKWTKIIDFLECKNVDIEEGETLVISAKNNVSDKIFAVVSYDKNELFFKKGTLLIFDQILLDPRNYDGKFVLIVTDNLILSIKKLFVEGKYIFLQSTDLNIVPQKITNNIRIIAYLIESRMCFD